MKQYSNAEVAQLLKRMAAAYQILNENRFKIIAYERAADSIQHLTSEVKDLWDDGKLDEIPGVGPTILSHLDELFRTGSVKHISQVLAKIPPSVFPLLLVPGVGPKRAFKLVRELKLDNEKTVIEDIEKAIAKHAIASIEGFGEKSEQDLLQNIRSFREGSIKEHRILLSEADQIATDLIAFLKRNPSVVRVDILGSLRRSVATIGDIDISVTGSDPKGIVSYFCTYPHQKLIEQGPTGASILLHNGRQVDLRVQDAKSYGAMLQYFTGSKNHNIALRSYALTKHLSLSEYGIKRTDGNGKPTGIAKPFTTEEAFYGHLGMQWIPPELREGKGEIGAALKHELPTLVALPDIRGDMHLHTAYDLESSHDLGADPLSDMMDAASALGYRYIGISDHNPSAGNHSDAEIARIMEKREAYYRSHAERWNKTHTDRMDVFVMLEVDIRPDGTLALPPDAFRFVDAVIVSVHSSFVMDRQSMTRRILTALDVHPKVKILGHPTGRLLTRRESIDADWPAIFRVAKEKDIALEINASPYRLDLPDALVYDALDLGCRFVIDTDAHAAADMHGMKYGVSVARRGWAQKRDILNTYPYNEMKKWLLP